MRLKKILVCMLVFMLAFGQTIPALAAVIEYISVETVEIEGEPATATVTATVYGEAHEKLKDTKVFFELLEGDDQIETATVSGSVYGDVYQTAVFTTHFSDLWDGKYTVAASVYESVYERLEKGFTIGSDYADLSDLQLFASDVKLDLAFASDILTYTTLVPFDTEEITVSTTVSNEVYSITVGDEVVLYPKTDTPVDFEPIALDASETTIEIKVVAQSGNEQIYEVTVRKKDESQAGTIQAVYFVDQNDKVLPEGAWYYSYTGESGKNIVRIKAETDGEIDKTALRSFIIPYNGMEYDYNATVVEIEKDYCIIEFDVNDIRDSNEIPYVEEEPNLYNILLGCSKTLFELGIVLDAHPFEGLGGDTTDWAQIEDYTDADIVFHVPDIGKISFEGVDLTDKHTVHKLSDLTFWLEPLYVDLMDFEGSAFQDSAAQHGATIEIYNLSYLGMPYIYSWPNEYSATLINYVEGTLTFKVNGMAVYEIIPDFIVTSPIDGTVTTNSTITVSGTVYDPGATVRFIVNNVTQNDAVEFDLKTGVFSGDVYLSKIGPNDIEVKVENLDIGYTAWETITVERTTIPDAADADLSGLNISAGKLVPEFSANVTKYNVDVANDVSQISVTPTVASDVYAALTVNDKPANSGVEFGPIDLNLGSNDILVKVTAEDNETTKTYTITVNRAQKSSGGSGGSGGGGSSPSDKEPSNDGTEVKVPAPAPKLDQSSGVASAAVDKAALDKAFKLAETNADGVKQVTIAIEKVNGAKAYKPELPAKALSGNAEQQVKLETEFADLVAPGNMFDSSKAKNADTIALSIGIADTTALDTETQALVSNRPVIELNAFIDGKAASWNNPDAPVTVAIPYKPTAKELKDPEHIVIIHIDKNGNVIPVPNGRYDTATGKVVFTTTHFSQYAVAYVTKTFDDITAYGWAQKQIEVMASKGVINGTSATTYTPAANITRADFMLLLVRALGLSAKTVDNFDDIDAGAYYADAVAIAKKLGITNGIGNNKFNPEAAISRQDMMVLAEKAMTAAKKSIAAGSAKDLNKFSDASDIADYASDSIAAMVKDGIVKGDGYRINPLGNATRAEVGVIIYRIYNQ